MTTINKKRMIQTTAKALVEAIVDARVEGNDSVTMTLAYKEEYSPKHLRAIARKKGLKLHVSKKLMSNRMVLVIG